MKNIRLSTFIVMCWLAAAWASPADSIYFEHTAPDAETVCVAGEFNDWNSESHPLEKQEDGTWYGEFEVEEGSYGYKLIVDGEWMMDPGNPQTTLVGEHENSLLVTSERLVADRVVIPVIDLSEPRTWTAQSGAQITATFIEIADGNVILEKDNGKSIRIKPTLLSEEDQALIADRLAPPVEAEEQEAAAPLADLELCGTPIERGKKTVFRAPLSFKLRGRAANNGNPRVTEAVVGLYVPEGFDPAKSYPMMIVSATSDDNASSIGHADQFLASAKEQGWVVMAADGPEDPNDVSNDWRWSMILGGLEAMHEAWPASEDWSMATGGYSGGAKRSGYIGALLVKAGYRLIGMYMGGCNQDMASKGLLEYGPKPSFKRTPIFLSTGLADEIAPPKKTEGVVRSMKKNKFKNIRSETYDGGHDVYEPHIADAMEWFSTEAKTK